LSVKTIDLRGLKCPKPLIEALKIISELKNGEIAEIYMDSSDCARLLIVMRDVIEVKDINIRVEDNTLIIHVEKSYKL